MIRNAFYSRCSFSLSLSLPLFLSRSLWVVVKPRPHLYLPTYDAASRALFVPPVILPHFGGSAERVVHSRHSRCIRNVEFPREKAHTYTYQPIPMERVCMVVWICVRVGVTLSPNAKCELVVEPSKANCCIIPEARSQPLPT